MHDRGPVLRLSLLAALAVTFTAAAFSGQPSPSQDAVSLLRSYVRATDAELKRLERGGVISKTLDSPDGKEVTSFGAIRVACTADVFAERVRDIERFKASEYVIQIGRFKAQPAPEDLLPLTLDVTDRDAMRVCRPGNCGLRLPAAAMEHFRTSIPWGTPGETDAAAAAMRQFLLEEARTYLKIWRYRAARLCQSCRDDTARGGVQAAPQTVRVQGRKPARTLSLARRVPAGNTRGC